MNRFVASCFSLVVLTLATLHAAGDFAVQREQVLALAKLTTAPAVHDAEGFASDGGIRAIFFDALPWKGKPTRVFAWLGLPQKRAGKAPGVVLVHGGGGTAFKEWVKRWNKHGFAAISIAVEGQTDESIPGAARREWKRHAWAGPARQGIYGDSSEPLADQWIYHAVADTVLANSLLRSLPEVNAEKVGIMGVSWGGVITSTVIGIDARFAFAIPTYGCGHLFDAGNRFGRALAGNTLYREVWDPMNWMSRVRMPALWFSWPEDGLPMDCRAATYRAAPGPRMNAIIPGLTHSHVAAWTPPDSYAFADAIVREGRPWCVQANAKSSDGKARVEFAATKPLDRAVLISTTDTGITTERKWIESAAVLERKADAWVASASIPPGTTAWFINVRSGGLTASSDYQATK